MSDLNHGTDARTDQALEQLLKKASPRPTPSADEVITVREALRAEWQQVSGRRNRQRQVVSYAIAATVLVGVFALFSVFRAPGVEAVQVATIEKSFGSIYLLGESAKLRETPDLSNVLSGQTIVTGGDAGIALAWGNGGSLRVDENTRVEFTSREALHLKSGRIYFDSTPSPLIAGITAGKLDGLIVRTDHSQVRHIGTQFMTQVNREALVVSVREGQVSIEDGYREPVPAFSGQQVTFSGRQGPTVLAISPTHDSWGWVRLTSPPADVDGKPIYDFLDWVAGETGFDVRYVGEAEQVARKESLRGTIKTEPLQAVQMWMATTTLAHRIDEEEGVIYVGDDL